MTGRIRRPRPSEKPISYGKWKEIEYQRRAAEKFKKGKKTIDKSLESFKGELD